VIDAVPGSIAVMVAAVALPGATVTLAVDDEPHVIMGLIICPALS